MHKWLILAAILLFSATVHAASSQIELAHGGTTSYVIVTPDDAIPAEQTAAKELADYLHQITGATFSIHPESSAPSSAPAIYVGAGKRARQLAPDVKWDDLTHDGIAIKSRAPDLILAGGRPRGTLYAVYTFLEDYLGVRWWTSTETEIPKSETLSIPSDLNIAFTPNLRYREIFNHDVIHGTAQFAARMKLNGHHMSAIPPELGGHYTLIGWCHTFYDLIPPGEFFSTHPEWFAMQKGKRNPDNAQLCLSNDAMREELTRRVLKRINKHPDAGIISVSQNDGYGPCQCDKCQAIVKAEGSESGPILRLVNSVAAEVAKKHPDFLVETLAYVYSRKPPKITRPAPNVLIRLCSIECDFSHPLTAPSNKSFYDDLRNWSAIAPNLFIWNYVTNFSNYLIPHPNFDPLGADLRLFTENHVVGVFEQGDAYNVQAGDMLPLRTWVLAKLLWDPSLDQRKLRDEFLTGYFKAAGPMLAEYMDLINAIPNKPRFTRGCGGADASYITPETLSKMNDLFIRAEHAVASDPVAAHRVRRERLIVDHLNLLNFPYEKRIAELKAQGKPPQAMVEEYEKLARAYVKSAQEMGTRQMSEMQDLSSYIPELIGRAERFVPVELPAYGAKLPPNQFDVQEDQFNLYRLGQLTARVDDPKASNGRAASMTANHSDWAIQFALTDKSPMIGQGPWKCYVVARCEMTKPKGRAFILGIHDPQRNNFAAYSPIDAARLADGEYHTFAIPMDELRPKMYFWLSPTGNANVKHIYVDRIFFIKSK